MTRIDWIILRRLASRIALTITVFFGLIMLVESIDGPRYNFLISVGGLRLALIGMVSAAGLWLMKGLPLLVLVGTVIGVIDLQSRRELIAIKASGASMWRIIRVPMLAMLLFGLGVTLAGESIITEGNRSVEATLPGDNATLAPSNGFWLEQSNAGQRYILAAAHVVANGQELRDVSIFLPDGLSEGRIVAPSARLAGGAWLLPTATRYRAGLRPAALTNFRMPTGTTPEDLHLRLSSTEDMTFYDLLGSAAGRISDPALRRAVLTRLLRLAALPGLLVGALFIAFAFAAGYRRTAGYGRPVVYAILIGFVVFVITEMAGRAGASGALDPTFAACGPAFVAIVTGLTVLLYREDGWA